jgi:hypothetical protein
MLKENRSMGNRTSSAEHRREFVQHVKPNMKFSFRGKLPLKVTNSIISV